MRRMQKNELASLQGGGCMKWIRRHNREARKGSLASQVVMDALIEAFEDCIDAKYS